MDRRHFLTTGGAAALSLPFLAGCTTAGARAPMVEVANPLIDTSSEGLGDAALKVLFQRIFDDQVKNAPTYATFLGLDKGANARARLAAAGRMALNPADRDLLGTMTRKANR